MDKPLNLRQSLFVKYYLDGDTKGNAYKSAIKAGYSHKFALQAAPRLLENVSIKPAMEAKQAVMEAEDVNSREFVTKSFLELAKTTKGKDNGTYTRALENLAKNSGWYEADNEQQREHSELNEQQQADLDEFIAWKHRQMLRGA